MPVLLVGGGGALGSILRYGLSLLAQRYSVTFPHGTLWANLLGCLVIGVVTTLATNTSAVTPAMRLFLATGICGGFTTMSSFIYELAQFVRDREWMFAGAYLVITFAGCMLMFWIGVWLVQWALKA
jgi:CrcB protein